MKLLVFGVPVALTGGAIYTRRWLYIGPLALLILMLSLTRIGGKRDITPERWADELERHLTGSEGPYDWDDTTSIALADERLERLRVELVPEYDRLDTPEKRQRLRYIVDSLRRGEIPD